MKKYRKLTVTLCIVILLDIFGVVVVQSMGGVNEIVVNNSVELSSFNSIIYNLILVTWLISLLLVPALFIGILWSGLKNK